jgi:hypothetical protein
MQRRMTVGALIAAGSRGGEPVGIEEFNDLC